MDRTEQQFALSDMITRYISGESDEDSQAKLRAWLEESKEHRQLFERLCSKEMVRRKVGAYGRIKPEDALYKLLAEKNSRRRLLFRRRVIKTLRYAAILILLLGVGVYFYKYGQQPVVVGEEEILGYGNGKPHVVLTLANGEVLKLSGSTSKQIQQAGQIVVINDSGRLEYQIAGDDMAMMKEQYNKVEVPRGGEYALVLSDGTKVWLNAESCLRYPVVFVGKQRKVYLEGEAYFEVNKDKEHEFVVTTESVNVTVYGTSFNVKDYSGEDDMAVTLISGSVGVNTMATNEKLMLEPGEQAVLSGSELSKENVDVNRYIAWREGKIVFVSTPLEEMLHQLSRWYDIKVVFTREDARRILFTGEIVKYEDFNDVLDVIRSTYAVKAKLDKGTVIIY